MKFWKEVVSCKSIPTDKSEKLKYNAEQIFGSVLTQEYHIMICEGLEYSYVTIGLALVLLSVPYDDPGTLMYFLCEPNIEVHNDPNYEKPKTAIARVLCLILMSLLSPVRDHNWRKDAKARLRTWATSFSLVRSKIPDEELRQTPPDSTHTSFESTSDITCSEWLPSPEQSPSKKSRAQPRATCEPPQTDQATDLESSDSDSNLQAPRRKRTLSELMSGREELSVYLCCTGSVIWDVCGHPTICHINILICN